MDYPKLKKISVQNIYRTIRNNRRWDGNFQKNFCEGNFPERKFLQTVVPKKKIQAEKMTCTTFQGKVRGKGSI